MPAGTVTPSPSARTSTGGIPASQTDDHPVVLVTYGDATAFTGWASRKTGKRVRLPTEAEWEFAARGGTATPWYGGTTEAENVGIGWFKSNAGNGTRPVGQKKANPLGLFDMSGNVFEWCRDVYGPYHDAAATDPEVATNLGAEPDRRVLRGGSWLRDIKRARSSARFRNAPGSRNADNGFRVVVTNEEAVSPGVGGPPPAFAPANPLGTSSAAPVSTAPTGPLADGEPLRLDPIAHGGEGFSWTMLLASPLAAAAAVVAWMLLRRKRRPAATPATRSGVSTRAVADGFFVIAQGAAPGARARYECLVNGTQVSDVVPLAGEETFVYTGSPPSGIRIVEVVVPSPGYRMPDRPPAQAGIDPGLVPPSSRPRPPPVPARPALLASQSLPALLVQSPSDPYTHGTAPQFSSSHVPLVLPLIDRLTHDAPPPSSNRMPPEPVETVVSATQVLPVDPSATIETAPLDAGSVSEPFLGNPRAY